MNLRYRIWELRRKLAVWIVERLYGEDMLWDEDDPEQIIGNMDEWAQDVWGGSPGDSTTVKFMRALSLPTLTYRVTAFERADEDFTCYRFERISKRPA